MGTLQRQIVSLFALVAFATTSASDVLGLHECPHHDIPAATAHADHPGMSGHVPDAHSGSTSQDHDDHGPCKCVGTCSANPPATALADAHVTSSRSVEQSPVVNPTDAQPHSRLTPYLLPWANAPPLFAS